MNIHTIATILVLVNALKVDEVKPLAVLTVPVATLTAVPIVLPATLVAALAVPFATLSAAFPAFPTTLAVPFTNLSTGIIL